MTLAPLVIAAGLLMVGVFGGAFLAAWLQQSLFGESLRTVSSWFAFVVVAGLWVGSLAAGAIAALAVAFVLLGPLLEKLSERVEEASGLKVHRSPGLRWEIVQSLKSGAYFALGAPISILLGLIPFVGPVLSLAFTGHRLAFQNTDIVLLRRGQTFSQRRDFHSRFRPETLGFGIASVLVFPIISVAALPIFVIAATKLVNDLEEIREQPSDEETAAILAAENLPIA